MVHAFSYRTYIQLPLFKELRYFPHTPTTTQCLLPEIPQIKPTFLDIAPFGMPRTIIPRPEAVNRSSIRLNFLAVMG